MKFSPESAQVEIKMRNRKKGLDDNIDIYEVHKVNLESMRKCLDDEIELCSGNFYLSILRAIASLSN
jgi:hypothetical protein